MAKSAQQIERRNQLTEQIVEASIDVSSTASLLRDQEARLERLKRELEQLDEIENRD